MKLEEYKILRPQNLLNFLYKPYSFLYLSTTTVFLPVSFISIENTAACLVLSHEPPPEIHRRPVTARIKKKKNNTCLVIQSALHHSICTPIQAFNVILLDMSSQRSKNACRKSQCFIILVPQWCSELLHSLWRVLCLYYLWENLKTFLFRHFLCFYLALIACVLVIV